MKLIKSKKNILIPALMVSVLCSCSGAAPFREPVVLPERDIAELAAQIEDIVLNTTFADPMSQYDEDAEWTDEVVDIDPVISMIGTDEIRQKAPALAKLNVDNEIMLTAIRGRTLRRPAVRGFESAGCVGENRRALLQYLRTGWCPDDRDMKSRAGFAVLSENRDRRAIFEQIVEANALGSSAHDRIREIFAEEIRKKAWADTPLEAPDGSWERK